MAIIFCLFLLRFSTIWAPPTDISTQPLDDRPFEEVISIGASCLTKSQINQYFAPELPSRETKKGHAGLFDWMRICDYRCLAKVLGNGLADYFELNDFDIHQETYGSTAVVDHRAMLWNRKNHMIWRHLFDSKAGMQLWNAERDGPLTREKLQEIFPELIKKMIYLKEKFLEAKHKKTLYIIAHQERTGEQSPDVNAIIAVRDALAKIRGNNQFTLLFLPHQQKSEEKFEVLENIVVREARNLKDGWNGGNSSRWKEILDEFSFTPNIWD